MNRLETKLKKQDHKTRQSLPYKLYTRDVVHIDGTIVSTQNFVKTDNNHNKMIP